MQKVHEVRDEMYLSNIIYVEFQETSDRTLCERF